MLFADVVNFTGMSEKLDPEDVHDIMDGCFEILGREIHAAGGTINQYAGDGVMALFGAPIAYDDHIRPACHAALKVRKRLQGYSQEMEARYGIPFQMRIGLHAGPVLVGAIGDNLRLDYTAVGDTTNLAARLQALAGPGDILVSERIWRGAGDKFRFRDAGLLEIKGRTEPVHAYFLEDEVEEAFAHERSAPAHRPFVGREKELRLLQQGLDEALSDGPKLVAISGEAGIGKTRLLHHFSRGLQGNGVVFLEGRCRPYGQTVALFPLSDMFRSYFKVSEPDSFEKVKAKVLEQVKDPTFSRRLEVVLELLTEIRGEEVRSEILVDAKRRQFFRAMRDLVLTAAGRRPMVIAIRNMQWVDGSTRSFLSYLTGSQIKAPILVVCLGRADPASWVPGVPDHLIRLNPLSENESKKLLNSVLGTERLDSRIAREIISNAGGNPLFLVEMGETLRRRGLIVCGPVTCRLTVPLSDLRIPDSIQGVLAARLDGLRSDEKETAQLASVIGREFPLELLKVLAGDRKDLEETLEGLERSGIIETLPRQDGVWYRFRQQMLRDVAYESILRKEKKRYHLTVAEALEEMFRNNLTENLSLLSDHYYRGEAWEKALAYTLEAGEQARRSYSCEEALICFDRALKIISRSRPPGYEEMTLQLYDWKGKMHFCRGQMKKAFETFENMRTLATRLKDREREAEALFLQGWTSFYMHRPQRAKEFLEKAVSLGDQEDLKEILLKSTSLLGYIHAVLGKMKEARPYFSRARGLSSGLQSAEGRAWSTAHRIQYANWSGRFQDALILNEELRKLNLEIRSPYFDIFQHFTQGLILCALGRTEEAEQSLRNGLKRVEQGDDTFWRPRFLNSLGWVYAEEGDYEKALRLNMESLKGALDSGNPETIHNARINLGENHLALGNLTEARDILEKTWEEVKTPGVFYSKWRYKTRLFLALAELYTGMGERKKGFAFLRKALDLAERNGARRHQARALLLKGRFLRKTRPAEGRKCLERALRLSEEMGTIRLSHRIRKEITRLDSQGAGA
ncbi:MAG: tetratricopeptide repeat protein [Deltaproteobacteria bacterium]|nr:tetratricopeptide repeat protein [Deltaproteobacteria bacterium]MBW1951077.1 tetratricopeptide repeat protein [Deltaproteobacteria bacterium]MBW2009606.1 tetratricopeptide repeat protein [Deltaproteobacteria bacterium]